MEGHFVMVGSAPPAFQVRIPHFPLTEPTVGP